MQSIPIVDDNPTNREFRGAALQDHGGRRIEGEGGAQAVDPKCQPPPDLVTTGLPMPALDGYALARRIADDVQLAGTRVIFHSGAYRDARGVRAGRPDLPSECSRLTLTLHDASNTPDGDCAWPRRFLSSTATTTI